MTQSHVPLVRAEEIAALLGVSRKHVYNLCQSNRIPHCKIGRLTRFDVSQVMEWAKTNDDPPLRKP